MAEPQLEKAATEPSIFEQVTTLAKPPIVRMDRSRDFASVHGERIGSEHAEVFFYQDGLPYSSQGVLLWQRDEVMKNKKLLAKAERLLKRALKLRMEAPGDDADDDDDEDDLDEREEEEAEEAPLKVNLTEWASGKEYPWQEVSNAIARKFFRRVNNRRGALELLIEERVISPGGLSKAHRKLLDSD
jgi:hypothetical protein